MHAHAGRQTDAPKHAHAQTDGPTHTSHPCRRLLLWSLIQVHTFLEWRLQMTRAEDHVVSWAAAVKLQDTLDVLMPASYSQRHADANIKELPRNRDHIVGAFVLHLCIFCLCSRLDQRDFEASRGQHDTVLARLSVCVEVSTSSLTTILRDRGAQ